MIDTKLFTVDALIRVMLENCGPGMRSWRTEAEIIPDYMPPFPRDDTRPTCVVRLGNLFLRHFLGPRHGFGWDIYGDDMQSPELALVALASAPPPPWMVYCERPKP